MPLDQHLPSNGTDYAVFFHPGGGGSGGGAIAVANDRVAKQSPIAGMDEEQIRERTPDDIPILVDDDIIARQLREAALAEDDPVLRERLYKRRRTRYKDVVR